MNILVAAGGTGGDLFPAIAVIEQLRVILGDQCSVLFVGNPHRIEARIVPELGFRFIPIQVTGFKGVFHHSTALLPFKVLHSIITVISICKRNKIDVIICGGTYISYPAGIVAHVLKIPMMLLESNVFPGKTNRLLASKADKIILAFSQSKDYFPIKLHDKLVPIGNPVRQSMLSLLPNKADARKSLGLHPDKPTLFVFGGSLGARSLNQAVESSMQALSQIGIQVLWQTGRFYTSPETLPDGILSRVFIDDMATAYAAADVVLCRSGGGTVAELAIVGKPSILVPLPSAANNEQEYNAKALQESGAALMIRDSELKDKFLQNVQDLFSSPELIKHMSNAALGIAKPNAASEAADIVIKLAEKHNSQSTKVTL